MTNTNASLESSARLRKIGGGSIAQFSLFLLVGSLVSSLAILYPLFVLVSLATAAALGLCWLAAVHLRRERLELWQVLVLIALTCYLLLNYGFDNLSIHIGGFPIIISYGLMYASLALAVCAAAQHSMARALKEPAVQCMLGLLVLALFHLVVDIPSYGVMAVRDSTMCLDGIFMLLGLLWAMKRNAAVFLTKWLMVVFVLSLIYSFTLPWGDKIWGWSPESGAFQKVPLLGNYHGTGDVLTAGAMFFLCIDGDVVGRPRWMMLCLAMAQLLGVAITQTRRSYLDIVIVFIILVVLGETKKYQKLLIILSSAIMALLLLTTIAGLKISGRIGEVNLGFFGEHINSMSGAEATPGSSVQSRFTAAEEALQHFRSHPVFGEGFGQPLLTEIDMSNGTVTRQPHNSSLSYLARLGLIGFLIWIAFHLCLMKRFVYAIRQRRRCDRALSDLVLWLFLFYLIVMVASLVEPAFEFPSSAVPFYFLMGLALGLIRWHLPQKAKTDYRQNFSAFAYAVNRPGGGPTATEAARRPGV